MKSFFVCVYLDFFIPAYGGALPCNFCADKTRIDFKSLHISLLKLIDRVAYHQPAAAQTIQYLRL